ncbi:MAG: helix-turn-helix transcriptional regulator, partial [Prevotella sp.]|nr:helix-turn-helix transcriptional regulator [Prevotella sp.]
DEIVENCYSDIENRTLRNTQIIIIFLVITSIISFLANVIGKEAFVDSLALVSIPCVVFAIILFMLLRAGHMQNFTIHELMEEAEETATVDNDNNTDIMRETTESVSAEVNAEKIRQISAEIEEVMRKEKPFLKPDLRVSDLARLLHTNRDYISKAIRLDKGMSFNEYVNRLRIEHAITLMKNNPQMSVLDLSVKSGYTSQASFFRNFKQFTGTSPKQFKCN